MKRLLVVLALTAVATAGCQAKPGAGEPGAKLLEERCLRCHPTGVKKAHKSRSEWEQTLLSMINRGAVLTEAEREVLISFLLKYY